MKFKTIAWKRVLGRRPANPDMASSGNDPKKTEYREVTLPAMNRGEILCSFCDRTDVAEKGAFVDRRYHTVDAQAEQIQRALFSTVGHLCDYSQLPRGGMDEIFRLLAKESATRKSFGRIFWSRDGDMDFATQTLEHLHAQAQRGDGSGEVKINLGKASREQKATEGWEGAAMMEFVHHKFDREILPVYRGGSWDVYFVLNEGHPTLPYYFVFDQALKGAGDMLFFKEVEFTEAEDLRDAIVAIVSMFNIPGGVLLMREALNHGGRPIQPWYVPTRNYGRISMVFPSLHEAAVAD